MKYSLENRAWAHPRRTFTIVSALSLVLACSEDKAKTSEGETGPFKSVTVAANDPGSFIQPLAGVPLSGDRTAILAFQPATDAETAPTPAIFIAGPDGMVELIHAGAPLVAPFDIDVSVGGEILIADRAAGENGLGAMLTFSLMGEAGTVLAADHGPVSVTVTEDGSAYFSGRNPETGQPGVFRVEPGGNVTTVFEGAPLVDPSGVAVFGDGRVLVADTSLFDGATELGSEAGVVLLENGAATVFVSGFKTGYPAGIALTRDESTLIVSGEGTDDRDKVYLVDVASRQASVVEGEFSVEQLSSGGLKRARASNRFVWSSGSYNGGTVYTIEG